MENNQREFKTGDKVRIIESIGVDDCYPVGSVIQLGEAIGGYFRIQGDTIGLEITKHFMQHIEDEMPLTLENPSEEVEEDDSRVFDKAMLREALSRYIDETLIDEAVETVYKYGSP